MRSIVALAVGLALWLAGLPGTPASAGAIQPTQCAGHTIRVGEVETREAGRATRVEILRGRTLVGSASDFRVPGVRCTDVTGDGRPELIVELFTGGAHCCTTIQIFQLQPSVRRILNYPAGNAPDLTIERGRDGRPALILGDDGLAYAADLCFACSPSSLPLVACFRGTRFADCTAQFPAVVRAAADEYAGYLRDAARAPGGPDLDSMRGAALGVYAAYRLLGREADGLAAVRRVVADPALAAWLTRQRTAVTRWIEQRPGRLTP